MLLGVDVGGTFTDAVLVEPGGKIHTAKVASTPADQALAVLEAVAAVLERAGTTAQAVRRFCHGMTVATNALLEGRAARTALLGTAGFEDVLELGRQSRPHLYRLCLGPPPPLVPAELRFGAPERMGPDGPLQALDPGAARSLVQRLARSRPEAVAVALLHSYRDGAHERMLGGLLAELMPGTQVSLSSELVGTFREFERTATTVLDAALSPLLGSYLERLAGQARSRRLPEPLIMQSSGGLAESERAARHAALTVLSGPAGGVAGARVVAGRAVAALAQELRMDTLACARGVVRVAETEMLKALRLLTVERGLDPRAFALMPFGGAGPLHAISMAEALQIGRVLCPQASGVLSALGLAGAAPRRDVARSVMLALGDVSRERLDSE